MPELDVLIVGAGPVGLFLANECARRGLNYRLIEAKLAQSEHSKALAVMPRTLEILDMAGVAAGFLAAANRVTWAAIHSRQHPLARVRFEPEDSPYPFVAMVPQNVTEAILREALRGRGGDVVYNTELKTATATGDGVCATLQRAGVSESVQA
ncbi:MAG: FAD-dependent oxidoreductase, partial [Terriglobales bacterium]